MQENHNHIVFSTPESSTDTSAQSGILNFLNSPAENLIMAPPAMEFLFMLDPKLANLDRVKYKTHSIFIQQFHYKPNHFKVIESLANHFAIQCSLISTEKNQLLIAFGLFLRRDISFCRTRYPIFSGCCT